VRWITFHQPLVPGDSLIPDGYVEFATPSGIDASFIEVDLGHEALTVWEKKVREYIQLALSGEFEQRFRRPTFRVLVLAHSLRRLQSIRKTVAKDTQKIFWFAALDAVRNEKFFGPVWLLPTGKHNHPFFDDTI